MDKNEDFDRHGDDACNAVYYDGHVELNTEAQIRKAVADPEAPNQG